MAKSKEVSTWKTCKHNETSEGSVEAINKDILAYVVCDECGTILTWQRVKKGPSIKKEVNEIAPEVTETPKVTEKPKVEGRPTTSRPKPKAEKPAVEKPAEEMSTVFSDQFIIKGITSTDTSIVFEVEKEKDLLFEVTKESTPEKIEAVIASKDTYINNYALIVEYTTIYENGCPADAVLQKLIKVK